MRLSDFLHNQNISDAEFARAVGVDRSTITRLKKSAQSPGLALIRAIDAATKGKVKAEDFYADPPDRKAS